MTPLESWLLVGAILVGCFGAAWWWWMGIDERYRELFEDEKGDH